MLDSVLFYLPGHYLCRFRCQGLVRCHTLRRDMQAALEGAQEIKDIFLLVDLFTSKFSIFIYLCCTLNCIEFIVMHAYTIYINIAIY